MLLSNAMQEPVIANPSLAGHVPRFSRVTLFSHLFHSLARTWVLSRDLRSTNASEPSGNCHGTATFTKRAASPVIGQDGKLHLADSELLYHEKGEFEMSIPQAGHPPMPTFPFSRKYIWRLQTDPQAPAISVWFTKPGTDQIDYLFHTIDLTVDDQELGEAKNQVDGTGGHLCVEDFYSSSYSFFLSQPETAVLSWTTTHEVRGPNKDQVITTSFTRT